MQAGISESTRVTVTAPSALVSGTPLVVAPNLFGVLLKPFVGFKLVTTVHGWVKHTAKTPLYYAIDRWTLPRHEQVIVVSADLYERCRACGDCAISQTSSVATSRPSEAAKCGSEWNSLRSASLRTAASTPGAVKAE